MMWSKTYSKQVNGVTIDKLWQVWANVNQWHTWQPNIEYAKLAGEFKVGNVFLLKPKGSPRVTIELIKVDKGRAFTDLTRFPGARMYGHHEFIEHGNTVELRITMSMEGILSFLWKRMVAQSIVDGMPAQTDALIERAKSA